MSRLSIATLALAAIILCGCPGPNGVAGSRIGTAYVTGGGGGTGGGTLSGGGKTPGGAYLTQATWYVDPSNVSTTASDAGDCATSVTPCRTYAELDQRWGVGGHLLQDTNVFQLSDGVLGDPINARITVEQSHTLAFYGGPTTAVGSGATSLQTGTFSSVTNLAQATNVPTQATDAGARTWTAFLGKRVRDTTTNAYAWVAKDLTGGAARFSSPSQNNSLFVLNTVTTSSFNTTNTYQVEDLRKVWLGTIGVTMGNGASGTIGFQDFEVQSSVLSFSDATVSFRGTRFKSSAFTLTGFTTLLSNCEHETAYTTVAGITQFDAGLMRLGGLITKGGVTIVDGDFLSQVAMLLNGGGVLLGAAAVFDATASVGGNPRGSGIVVGGTGNSGRPSGATARVTALAHGTAAIYGANNAGCGLDVFPAHRVNVLSGGTFAITGNSCSSGNFILGSDASNMTYAVKATGSVAASYGLALTGSWANFVAANPGGFGGNAHNVAADAHLITN